MTQKIDDLDKQIIALLQEDGRISNRKIAQQLGGISEGTVRIRIKNLREKRMLLVGPIVSPEAGGLAVTAVIYISAHSDYLDDYLQKFTEFKEAKFVSRLMGGKHQILIVVLVRDRAALRHLIFDRIKSLPGINDVTTEEAITNFRMDYKWAIL